MNSEMNQQDAPQPAGEEPAPAALTPDEKQWLVALHFCSLIGLLIPLGSIIAPLIVWLIKKDEFPLVNEHGKAVLNFQITVAIAFVVCFLLVFVLIGILLLPILTIFWIVMTIIGGVKAADGKLQNFFLTIPMIR